ncbi:MAG: hypothetical protein ACREOU_02185 [Candidatus Eiseniibacteriota bacterium]
MSVGPPIRPPFLAFAIAFAVFHIAPAYLRAPVPFYPLLESGDVFDLVTPIVLVPLWGALFLGATPGTPKTRTMLIFLALAVLWTLGQGMHLTANSIGHLSRVAPESDVNRLAHFYDERLSHLLWYGATFALTTLILAREAIHGAGGGPGSAAGAGLATAALIHGITLFIIIVEGQAGWIGVPFAVGVTLYGLRTGRRARIGRPVLRFFTLAYGTACVLFAIWGAYWRGLPEFSAVGIID